MYSTRLASSVFPSTIFATEGKNSLGTAYSIFVPSSCKIVT